MLLSRRTVLILLAAAAAGCRGVLGIGDPVLDSSDAGGEEAGGQDVSGEDISAEDAPCSPEEAGCDHEQPDVEADTFVDVAPDRPDTALTCAESCPVVARTTLACYEGACTFACDRGYHDCNDNRADGCETEGFCKDNEMCAGGGVSTTASRCWPDPHPMAFGAATTPDLGYSVAFDPSGNIYVAGGVGPTGPTDFEGHPVSSFGKNDALVMSFTPDRHIRWTRSVGGPGDDVAIALATDGTHVFVAGTFRDTAAWGIVQHQSAGENDAFLMSLAASDGSIEWSITFGGTGDDSINALVLDSAGNIYLAGAMDGTVDFGDDCLLTEKKPHSGYLVSLSPDRHCRWVTTTGSGTGDVALWHMSIDHQDRLFLTGPFIDPVIISPDRTLQSAGKSDTLYASYDSEHGTIRWAQRMGGAGSDLPGGIVSDDKGHVYATGGLTTKSYFGDVLAPDGQTLSPGGDGEYDGYLVRLDEVGNVEWLKQFGSTGWDSGTDVACDSAGNVYVTGTFGLQVDFGGGLFDSQQNIDVFVASYNPGGGHRWSTHFGAPSWWDWPMKLALSTHDSLAVTGYFSGDAQIGDQHVTTVGGPDIFLLLLDAPLGPHL